MLNTESSIVDADGPVYGHPKDNTVVKIDISEGVGKLTKQLFDECESLLFAFSRDLERAKYLTIIQQSSDLLPMW